LDLDNHQSACINGTAGIGR